MLCTRMLHKSNSVLRGDMSQLILESQTYARLILAGYPLRKGV